MNDQNVVLTLIDGPTLLIEIGGLRLLTDPAFDPPQSYDSAGATIIELAGPPVTPDKLGKIDAFSLAMISISITLTIVVALSCLQ
jgi:L-ascorbate metabolism protein UlaG (beta-lactamase superfamily)